MRLWRQDERLDLLELELGLPFPKGGCEGLGDLVLPHRGNFEGVEVGEGGEAFNEEFRHSAGPTLEIHHQGPLNGQN